MRKPISKEAETKLVAALDRVHTLIQSGETPNDAIYKVASEDSIVPGHVNLMVQAYNTGRTNAQRKTIQDEDIFAKAASFPLADASVILEKMYPSEVKTAAALHDETVVSVDYNRFPSWDREVPVMEKAASYEIPRAEPRPYPQEPGWLTKRAFDLMDELRRESDEKRRLSTTTRDKLASALADLDEYFRQPGCLPFPWVRSQVDALYGRMGNIAMKKVAEHNPKLERQTGHATGGVHREKAPFTLVEAVIKSAYAFYDADIAHQQHQTASSKAIGDLTAAILPEKEQPAFVTGSVLEGVVKKAAEKKSMMGSFGDALKATMAVDVARKVLNKSPVGGKSDEELKQDSLEEVTDPVHESRLQNLNQQFMLNDLMANDEVISSYPPEEVLEVYNQVSQMAPRAAQKKMLVQSLLRRHLSQGQVDTHDVDQLAGVESKLKQKDEPEDQRKYTAEKPSVLKTSSVLAGVI